MRHVTFAIFEFKASTSTDNQFLSSVIIKPQVSQIITEPSRSSFCLTAYRGSDKFLILVVVLVLAPPEFS